MLVLLDVTYRQLLLEILILRSEIGCHKLFLLLIHVERIRMIIWKFARDSLRELLLHAVAPTCAAST